MDYSGVLICVCVLEGCDGSKSRAGRGEGCVKLKMEINVMLIEIDISIVH